MKGIDTTQYSTMTQVNKDALRAASKKIDSLTKTQFNIDGLKEPDSTTLATLKAHYEKEKV